MSPPRTPRRPSSSVRAPAGAILVSFVLAFAALRPQAHSTPRAQGAEYPGAHTAARDSVPASLRGPGKAAGPGEVARPEAGSPSHGAKRSDRDSDAGLAFPALHSQDSPGALARRSVREVKTLSSNTCQDAGFCVGWGTSYCSPKFKFLGYPIGTYWCPKTCNKCAARCKDRDLKCKSWGKKQCKSNWKGKSIAKYWCRRKCGSCKTGGKGGTGIVGKPCKAFQCQLNRELLKLVNSLRAANGKSVLCLNDKLIRAAAKHSQDMLAKKYKGSTGKDGSTPQSRVAREKFVASSVGENVIQGPQYKAAMDAYLAFLNDPSMKANMLGEFKYVGAFKAGQYWTQDFAAAKAEVCSV